MAADNIDDATRERIFQEELARRAPQPSTSGNGWMRFRRLAGGWQAVVWVVASPIPATLWALKTYPNRRRVVWAGAVVVAFLYVVAIVGAASSPSTKSPSVAVRASSESPTTSAAPTTTA